MTQAVLKDVNLRCVAPGDVRFLSDFPNGHLLVYEEPRLGFSYFVGVDVSLGKGLSNSVLSVVRRGNSDSPDRQVAEWACDFLDPHQVAPIAARVGRWYWSSLADLPAEICIEVYPGPGGATQYDLQTFHMYENVHQRLVYDASVGTYTSRFGWRSTAASRRELVVWGEHQLRTGALRINSPFLLDELENFTMDKLAAARLVDDDASSIRRALGSARAKRGHRDDRVIALFLAEWAAHALREGEDPSVVRERKAEELAGTVSSGVTFQNTDISYGDMMRKYYN